MTYRNVHLSQVKPSGFATHLIEHLVEKYQPQVRSLLDVGCGAGGYTREWQKKFHLLQKKVLKRSDLKIQM